MVDLRKIPGAFANVNGKTVFMNKANGFMGSIQLATKEAVEETVKVFFASVQDNISKDPHTPYQLKKMGHPFAVRHGKIQPHGHTPDWSVHKVSGDMLSSLKKEVVVRSKTFVFGLIGWENVCPDKVKRVVFGTKRMLKRPVLRLTANAINLNELFYTNLLRYARRGMKGGNIPGGYRGFNIVKSMQRNII